VRIRAKGSRSREGEHIFVLIVNNLANTMLVKQVDVAYFRINQPKARATGRFEALEHLSVHAPSIGGKAACDRQYSV